jgi:hypothetical protein
MKNAVITRTDADPATARDGFLDDPHAPLANTSWTTSALGNFFRIIVLTLSDFLILSVVPRAFLNRADYFF